MVILVATQEYRIGVQNRDFEIFDECKMHRATSLNRFLTAPAFKYSVKIWFKMILMMILDWYFPWGGGWGWAGGVWGWGVGGSGDGLLRMLRDDGLGRHRLEQRGPVFLPSQMLHDLSAKLQDRQSSR